MSADTIDHIRDLFRAGKIVLPPTPLPEQEPLPPSGLADAVTYGLRALRGGS